MTITSRINTYEHFTVLFAEQERLIHRFTETGSFVNVCGFSTTNGASICGEDYEVVHDEKCTIEDVLEHLQFQYFKESV